MAPMHSIANTHPSFLLQVMDETAITLCKENSIPVVVFNLTKPGNIMKALSGDKSVGTTVSMNGAASN